MQKLRISFHFGLFISEEWIGFGNRISIFLKKIRNSVSETALPKRHSAKLSFTCYYGKMFSEDVSFLGRPLSILVIFQIKKPKTK
jgi:hypothetical protein